MCSLAEFQLTDSELDGLLIFSRSGDTRRAVLTGDYTTSREYLSQLLIRRLSARAHAQNITSGLAPLSESGGVLPITLGHQCIGLMRPQLFGDPDAVRAADPPFLICFERHGHPSPPDFPVLAVCRDAAITLVRKLHWEREIDTQLWRGYTCERLKGALEKLVLDAHRGKVVTFATDLERDLAWAQHQARAKPKRRHAA